MGQYTPGGFLGLCGGNAADVHDPKNAPQDIPKDVSNNHDNKSTSADAVMSPATKDTLNPTDSPMKDDQSEQSNRNSNREEKVGSNDIGVSHTDSMMYSDDEKKNDSDGELDDGNKIQPKSSRRSLRRNQPNDGFSAPKSKYLIIEYLLLYCSVISNFIFVVVSMLANNYFMILLTILSILDG